jgi:hypothetical protein
LRQAGDRQAAAEALTEFEYFPYFPVSAKIRAVCVLRMPIGQTVGYNAL